MKDESQFSMKLIKLTMKQQQHMQKEIADLCNELKAVNPQFIHQLHT